MPYSSPPSRSIPACAGEPFCGKKGNHSTGVYPRVCGGTRRPAGLTPLHTGLSPRVRGNPVQAINAYASIGLSPRVRGNHPCAANNGLLSGSIPACAGEPCCERTGLIALWVYPRVCGGTKLDSGLSEGSPGLSPRVRGNRDMSIIRTGDERSIPACAGEPGCACGYAQAVWVYPRVCGGTQVRAHHQDLHVGLSPRVRGNRYTGYQRKSDWRSIPACAGEPGLHGGSAANGKVYPRVCGGTPMLNGQANRPRGLSPRVRGNHRLPCGLSTRRRSIPACAGEPRCNTSRPWFHGVYPRVCGGTNGTM